MLDPDGYNRADVMDCNDVLRSMVIDKSHLLSWSLAVNVSLTWCHVILDKRRRQSLCHSKADEK